VGARRGEAALVVVVVVVVVVLLVLLLVLLLLLLPMRAAHFDPGCLPARSEQERGAPHPGTCESVHPSSCKRIRASSSKRMRAGSSERDLAKDRVPGVALGEAQGELPREQGFVKALALEAVWGGGRGEDRARGCEEGSSAVESSREEGMQGAGAGVEG
jgi:hypothetical protein